MASAPPEPPSPMMVHTIGTLSSDPGIRPGRIDEAQDRDAEPFREPHEPHGFAVAFRPGHAEVSEDFFLGIASLLMADPDHRLAVETRKTSDNRGIVGK